MLTKEQKELLINLIDGYFYPRDLIKDYEKFLEIRKVLDPNDLWIDNFQHGYYVHPDLKKEVSKGVTTETPNYYSVFSKKR